jgi:hypothetical protein
MRNRELGTGNEEAHPPSPVENIGFAFHPPGARSPQIAQMTQIGLRRPVGLPVDAALNRYSPVRDVAFSATGRPNSCFTDSRTSTMMVNTPRTVPTGMKRHSTPAITRQKV